MESADSVQRGAGQGTLLTSEPAKDVAELFNEAYACALLILQQFFAFGGETEQQREALKAAAGQMMSPRSADRRSVDRAARARSSRRSSGWPTVRVI